MLDAVRPSVLRPVVVGLAGVVGLAIATPSAVEPTRAPPRVERVETTHRIVVCPLRNPPWDSPPLPPERPEIVVTEDEVRVNGRLVVMTESIVAIDSPNFTVDAVVVALGCGDCVVQPASRGPAFVRLESLVTTRQWNILRNSVERAGYVLHLRQPTHTPPIEVGRLADLVHDLPGDAWDAVSGPIRRAGFMQTVFGACGADAHARVAIAGDRLTYNDVPMKLEEVRDHLHEHHAVIRSGGSPVGGSMHSLFCEPLEPECVVIHREAADHETTKRVIRAAQGAGYLVAFSD